MRKTLLAVVLALGMLSACRSTESSLQSDVSTQLRPVLLSAQDLGADWVKVKDAQAPPAPQEDKPTDELSRCLGLNESERHNPKREVFGDQFEQVQPDKSGAQISSSVSAYGQTNQQRYMDTYRSAAGRECYQESVDRTPLTLLTSSAGRAAKSISATVSELPQQSDPSVYAFRITSTIAFEDGSSTTSYSDSLGVRSNRVLATALVQTVDREPTAALDQQVLALLTQRAAAADKAMP